MRSSHHSPCWASRNKVASDRLVLHSIVRHWESRPHHLLLRMHLLLHSETLLLHLHLHPHVGRRRALGSHLPTNHVLRHWHPASHLLHVLLLHHLLLVHARTAHSRAGLAHLLRVHSRLHGLTLRNWHLGPHSWLRHHLAWLSRPDGLARLLLHLSRLAGSNGLPRLLLHLSRLTGSHELAGLLLHLSGLTLLNSLLLLETWPNHLLARLKHWPSHWLAWSDLLLSRLTRLL